MEFTAWLPELWDDILPIGGLCDRMEGFISPGDCDTADESRSFDVAVDEEAIVGMLDADAFPDGTLDERLSNAPLDEGLADVLVNVAVSEFATDEGDKVMFANNELSDAPLEFEILVGLFEL